MDDADEIVVGIDLGTTNTAVAYYFNKSIRVLENSEGDRLTPSFVYFNEDSTSIVGLYAKKKADNAKPECGVYEIKRYIGRKYDDKKVLQNLENLSYTIEEEANEPIIVIKQPKETLRKTPIEICTTILSKVKRDIKEKLGTTKDVKAVITVPAYFNVSQRKATLKAAKNANFDVLKLQNEPTAAAFRYVFDQKKFENGDLFLVFDLGGGTFDIAVLKKVGDAIETVAVDGDSFLGGHDFNHLLLNHVCSILKERHNIDCKLNKRLLRRLQNECEDAKKYLSFFEECEITLEGVIPKVDVFEIKITRAEFELMATDLFAKTIDIVDSCLKNSNLSKDNIKEVVLCGGSTRIPKIQALLSNYFGQKTLNQFVNPDECVAEGAAIQAALLSKHTQQQLISSIKILDVTPLSIGIRVSPNVMDVVITRNTPIPCSRNKSFFTVENRQTNCSFDIYEGERTDCRKNRHLGLLVLENMTVAPPRQCEMMITMTIDKNGILKISAKEKLNNNIKELDVVYARGLMSDAEVQNSLKDAEDNKIEDKNFMKFQFKKGYLLNYCQSVIYNIGAKGLAAKLFDINIFCKTTYDTANNMEMCDEEKLIKLLDETQSKCENIVKMHKFLSMPNPI